ncbi:MAG TPA: SRPBCC family protein [Euzebya sp.]|nr:SRPBCC family protein [Euzebya sp.]
MMPGSSDLVVEQDVAAPPEVVFAFFTSADRWMLWQGTAAEIDCRPGGVMRVNVRGDGYASGEFVEVDPPRRLVFTFGWEQPGSAVPPGSTTVEIVLEPSPTGTRILLTQRGLPDSEQIAQHRYGWEHYLPRCAEVASGSDPGPDPAVVGRGV